jgi:hypothetical protein
VGKRLALVVQIYQAIEFCANIGHAARNHHATCGVQGRTLVFGDMNHAKRAVRRTQMGMAVKRDLAFACVEHGAKSRVYALKNLVVVPKGN